MPLKLLIVDDSVEDADLATHALRAEGFDVEAHRVDTEAEVQSALKSEWDVIISDFRMPRFSGLRAFELAQRLRSDTPFIFVSDGLAEDQAVLALKAGARDHLRKRSLKRLPTIVQRELDDAIARRARRVAESTLGAMRRRTNAELALAQRRLESFARFVGGTADGVDEMLVELRRRTELTVERLPEDDELYPDAVAMDAAARATVRTASRLRQLVRESGTTVHAHDLSGVVEGVLPLLRGLAGDKIELACELADEPCRVDFNRDDLEFVVASLVANARDAMPFGGCVRLRTECVGEAVELSVSDVGVGIARDVLPRVFDPSFTTRPATAGGGLGLALVRALVEAAGGQIELESELGEGTTVVVRLPLDNPRRDR